MRQTNDSFQVHLKSTISHFKVLSGHLDSCYHPQPPGRSLPSTHGNPFKPFQAFPKGTPKGGEKGWFFVGENFLPNKKKRLKLQDFWVWGVKICRFWWDERFVGLKQGASFWDTPIFGWICWINLERTSGRRIMSEDLHFKILVGEEWQTIEMLNTNSTLKMGSRTCQWRTGLDPGGLFCHRKSFVSTGEVK